MTLSLIVTKVRAEALDVISVELKSRDGESLPAFEPGAHLEFNAQQGSELAPLIRQYSICSDCNDSSRYVIAVARAAAGRGGSAAMHDNIRVGSKIEAREPRNNFPLEPAGEFYHFIAGGIGITPIMSMIFWCIRTGKSWSLLYCARSRNRAAFYETLREYGDKVRFHFDDESGNPVPDFESELAAPKQGEHVYCCGPAPLMTAVRDACAGRDEKTIHFEYFGAEQTSTKGAQQSEGFEVLLRRRGKRLHIPKDRSILSVLEDEGIETPSSCREGVCGACETTVCHGQVDHRDHVLSSAEKSSSKTMMICVSRALTEVIELDL